jgi:hypothetical protein
MHFTQAAELGMAGLIRSNKKETPRCRVDAEKLAEAVLEKIHGQ